MERNRRPNVGAAASTGPQVSGKYYSRLLYFSVLSVSLVAIIPLVVMTALNYHQYQEAFHAASLRPVATFTQIAKVSLEAFLSERVSALSLASCTESPADLRDPERLNTLLDRLKRSFGGFIDLGLVDEAGRQVGYAGPYDLLGKNYREQDWFYEVGLHGVYISDVFLGYRHLPHFVIAVSYDTSMGSKCILRATIDTDNIVRQIGALTMDPSDDAFLINQQGILQTPTRFHGKALDRCPLPVPPMSTRPDILETRDQNGDPLIIGYAFIERSPFILMLLRQPGALQVGWLRLRRNLLLFLTISIAIILAVVYGGSRYMVNRTRQADVRRAALYHEMEYTNKMAAIGRLAAGVAHEINNPLAIIGEKAGLHKDLLSMSEELPPKEKMIALVDAVLSSVDRCGTITHRLLGFAKHMDTRREEIDLEHLLKEVLGFLEKEAGYRNLQVAFHVDEDAPTVESDRGQLQQVFVNIVNNAFAAVDDHGQIDITISRVDPDHLSVAVCDNGVGISRDDLNHIFEPFFTTKRGAGTGLGLSITYGIVQKLGGRIEVSSEVGKGSCFIVVLPVRWDHP
jgi:two-component system NtrC family sensor kinase